MKDRTVLTVMLLLTVFVFLVPQSWGWPQTGDNETFTYALKSVHTGSTINISGGELQLITVAFFSTPSALLSFTTTAGVPINIANVTELTAPIITIEVWYIAWPTTQLPITVTPTATFSSTIYSALSSTTVANATLTPPYFEDVQTSAVNGNFAESAQVTVGPASDQQRELYAFVAAVATLGGSPSFTLTAVGSNHPIAVEDGTSKAPGSPTVPAAAISILTERDVGVNGNSGDSLGSSFRLSGGNGNVVSAVCIGLAVPSQP